MADVCSMERPLSHSCKLAAFNMVGVKTLRILITLILSATLTNVLITSASAWEFNLSGSLDWSSDRSMRRLKHEAPTNHTFLERLNGQLKHIPDSANRTSNTFKESDDASLKLYPQIRLSDTILLEGAYSIQSSKGKTSASQPHSPGGLGFSQQNNRGGHPSVPHWGAGGHQWGSPATRGAPTAAPGHIRAVVQVPIGMINVGEHEYPLGAYGVVGKSLHNESAFLAVPIGPLRFAYATRLDRQGFTTNMPTDSVLDAELHSLHAASVSYQWGNLGLGGLTLWRKMRSDPNNTLWSNQQAHGQYPLDRNSWINVLFVKLYNGALFAGGQMAWIRSDISERTVQALYPDVSSRRAARSWLAEAGVELGPTRLSLLYATVEGQLGPGLDPVSSFLPETAYAPDGGPMLVREVPTVLGAGHNSPSAQYMSKSLWTMPGAYRLAGRADCALAVNLNMWSSIIYAGRTSPVESNVQLSPFQVNSHLENSLSRIGSHRPTSGMIRSSDISHSWEFNTGLHWDLMNGLTMDMQYALYRPAEVIQAPNGIDSPGSQSLSPQSQRFVNYFQWDMALQF